MHHHRGPWDLQATEQVGYTSAVTDCDHGLCGAIFGANPSTWSFCANGENITKITIYLFIYLFIYDL